MSEADMSERDEIEMLLPWYATGKLTPDERTKVEAWLRREPGMARQLALARAEQGAASALAETIRPPSSLTVENTFENVMTRAGRRSAADGIGARLKAALAEFFTLPGGGLRYAAAAAALAVVAQGVLIATLIKAPQATYQVASGETAATAKGVFALVRFQDGATARAISDLLAARGMSIVDGPKPGGLYRVRIGDAGMSADQRDSRIAEIKQASGIVAAVLPTN